MVIKCMLRIRNNKVPLLLNKFSVTEVHSYRNDDNNTDSSNLKYLPCAKHGHEISDK